MYATGQECYHQSPIRNYFDSNYDLLFDPAVEHRCAHYGESVVPARRCGTSCPGFQPLSRIAHVPPPSVSTARDAAKHETRVRGFLKRALKTVCAEIERNAAYLEQQLAVREQRWREADAWLHRDDTQPEALAREMVQAEQRVARAVAEVQRVKRQLESVKAGHKGSQDLERLWLEQERWEKEVPRARQAIQRAEALMVERGRREAEQEQLYARWEDALERVPLLKQLHAEVMRCVQGWLTATEGQLSDARTEHILRFLKAVPRYASDDMPIARLKKTVDELSQRNSGP